MRIWILDQLHLAETFIEFQPEVIKSFWKENSSLLDLVINVYFLADGWSIHNNYREFMTHQFNTKCVANSFYIVTVVHSSCMYMVGFVFLYNRPDKILKNGAVCSLQLISPYHCVIRIQFSEKVSHMLISCASSLLNRHPNLRGFFCKIFNYLIRTYTPSAWCSQLSEKTFQFCGV